MQKDPNNAPRNPLSNNTVSQKTFVLVHGGYHGGWCWSRVLPILQQAGHKVYAPTITGVGERAHLLNSSLRLATAIEDIIQVVVTEELSDVVLVGHSIGGIYITGVADSIHERISQLVYLDAMLPDNGDTLLSLLPPARQNILRAEAEKHDYLVAPKPDASFFGLTNPDDIAWVNRRTTNHPWSTWADQLELKQRPGAGLPKYYIECVASEFPMLQTAKDKLRKHSQEWHRSTMLSTHDAMVEAPTQLAQRLMEIARSQ